MYLCISWEPDMVQRVNLMRKKYQGNYVKEEHKKEKKKEWKLKQIPNVAWRMEFSNAT